MAQRRYKTNRKKRISRFTVFGVLVLCTVFCFTFAYKKSELKEQKKLYSQQVSELEKAKEEEDNRTKELEEFEQYVDTDEYIEEVAREKLGLVRKNEIIFEPDN